MSLIRAGRLVPLLLVVVMLLTPSLATVQGKAGSGDVAMEEFTVGSGTAGAGTLSVRALWGIGGNTNLGFGDFNGTLGPLGATGTGPAVAAAFLLSSQVPTSRLPMLHCVSQEVGFSGTIVVGSFTGQQVLVFGCIGAIVSVGFAIGSAPLAGGVLYFGAGKGNFNVLQVNSGIFVSAPSVTGSGTDGTGSLSLRFTLFLSDSTPVLPGIGAFDGTLSVAGPTAGIFTIDSATLTANGCQFSGIVLNAHNSAHAQETVSGNCFPTQPSEVLVSFIEGDPNSPIFAGHGVGTLVPFFPALA